VELLRRKECLVSKEGVQTAYEEYQRTREKGRLDRVGLNIGEDGLWKLWVLALSYQAAKEGTSENLFRALSARDDPLVFNPARIGELAKECGCSLLIEEKTFQFCDFKKNQGSCSYSDFLAGCPVRKVCEETHRFARMAKQIVASALYLRSYDFRFDRLCASRLNLSIDDRTQAMLDTLTILAGEKIAHLFLGWVSNPFLNYGNWDLNYKRFLAINGNIKRVVAKIGLCNSKNTSVIRARLNELQEEMSLNPKVLELALLRVGQEYCPKRGDLKCERCPLHNNCQYFAHRKS
jgi:hypothetical protein